MGHGRGLGAARGGPRAGPGRPDTRSAFRADPAPHTRSCPRSRPHLCCPGDRRSCGSPRGQPGRQSPVPVRSRQRGSPCSAPPTPASLPRSPGRALQGLHCAVRAALCLARSPSSSAPLPRIHLFSVRVPGPSETPPARRTAADAAPERLSPVKHPLKNC